MRDTLRYVCADCNAELRRCGCCNSMVHGVYMFNEGTKEHSHSPCPAQQNAKGETLREVGHA